MAHYLFVGPNQYAIDHQIATRVDQFQAKYGREGYYRFDSQNFDIKNIVEALTSGGLFQEKKMVVIIGVPADKQSQNKITMSKIDQIIQRYQEYIDHISDNVMILRTSVDPDKRTKGYKYLSTHCQVKEFKTYTRKELIGQMQVITGSLLDTMILEHMIDMIGPDMYRLEHECHKLSQFALSHQIPKLTLTDVQKIIRSQEDDNVFGLLCAMIYKPQDAYEELAIAQSGSHDRNKYHGGIMRGLRTLCLVIDQYLQGTTSGSVLATTLGLNARSVSTILKQYTIDNQLQHKVKVLWDEMIGLEYKIKTSIIADTQYRLQVKQITTMIHE